MYIFAPKTSTSWRHGRPELSDIIDIDIGNFAPGLQNPPLLEALIHGGMAAAVSAKNFNLMEAWPPRSNTRFARLRSMEAWRHGRGRVCLRPMDSDDRKCPAIVVNRRISLRQKLQPHGGMAARVQQRTAYFRDFVLSSSF